MPNTLIPALRGTGGLRFDPNVILTLCVFSPLECDPCLHLQW